MSNTSQFGLWQAGSKDLYPCHSREGGNQLRPGTDPRVKPEDDTWKVVGAYFSTVLPSGGIGLAFRIRAK